MSKKHFIWALIIVAVVGLLVTGCAKQATEATDKEGITTGELPAWTLKSDCAKCHTAEAKSASNTATTYSAHASQQGVQCGTCHSDDDKALTEAHKDYATAEQPTKLQKTKVSPDTCSGCHNADDLKIKTAGVTVLTDSQGKTVNPHDLPVNADHTTSITCTSCHEMHGTDSVDETAPKVCLSCHHADVYECGTCHKEGEIPGGE
ncbi:MAG: hypothetical protein AB2L09_09750 [Coriobacteriia bacterium]